ncbi:MAG: hypothetical protein ACRBN8_06380 [Nannocystales bacterium]
MRARLSGAMAWLGATLGVLAAAAALASLWPDGGIPAWPAGSLGLAAAAALTFKGDVRPRALGTLCACSAMLACGLELSGLWAISEVLS